ISPVTALGPVAPLTAATLWGCATIGVHAGIRRGQGGIAVARALGGRARACGLVAAPAIATAAAVALAALAPFPALAAFSALAAARFAAVAPPVAPAIASSLAAGIAPPTGTVAGRRCPGLAGAVGLPTADPSR